MTTNDQPGVTRSPGEVEVHLEPCPCGGKPWVFGVTAMTPTWQAGCDKCSSYGKQSFSKQIAIRNWNALLAAARTRHERSRS